MKKLFSMFVALLMSLGILAPPSVPDEGIKADASVVFSDDRAGYATGTVTITANYDGNYELYWGDGDGNKLTAENKNGDKIGYSYFADIAVENGEGTEKLNEFLAIPDNAETMLLYYGDELLDTDPVPREKQTVDETETYSFASLSDIHFNRYNTAADDDAMTAFPTALNFLKDMGVSIVGVCGDLSKSGEASAYEKFAGIANGYDFPIFSCKGNHDCYKDFDYSAWEANMNPGVYTDTKREGVLNVADNGYDFVYSGEETHGDVFIFFSQITATYAPFVQLVTDEQISWLSQQLETYKNKRVYLYFHTFLNAPDGLPAMGEGNLINDYGISYMLPYVKGNKDEVAFRKLLEEYKNVIFFNGHSHWAYYMQSYNPRLNITDYDGTTATMVHVSSLSAPRTSDIKSPAIKSNSGTMSEGLYITAYPTHVITTACDFMNGQLLAYATYRIENK